MDLHLDARRLTVMTPATPISNERLAALDAAVWKMTDGPWEYVHADCEQPHTIMGPLCDGSATSVAHTPWTRPNEEATFRGIVLLRNEYAALRERLRQAEELLRPFAAVETHASFGDTTQAAIGVKGDKLKWMHIGHFRAAAAYFAPVEQPSAADAAGKEG